MTGTQVLDAVDAVDLIDGLGAVNLNDNPETQIDPKDDGRHDDDFDAFASAKSLDLGNAEKEGEAGEGKGVEKTCRSSSTKEDSGKEETATTATESSSSTSETSPPPKHDPKHRFVSPKDFELLKVIGMGAFGKVLQVRNKGSKQIMAMKVISKRLLRKKAGYIENIQAERNILTKVSSHPFVVTMHCSFQNKEKLFIIMDFLAGGELFLRIGKEGIFLEKTAAFYLAEIILALDHMHSLNVLHRDLKPENILLCQDGHICVTDFGLAKEFEYSEDTQPKSDDPDEQEHPDHRATTICGTQEYMAPEMVARQGYGRAADYWSLGCIAYEMLKGLPPFDSKKGAKDLFRKIMSERVKMPDGASAAACKLLKGLLNRNPNLRLGAARSTMFQVGGVAGLKQQPFFSHIDWEKLEHKEVEPPTRYEIQHDEDLTHFHDEFTSMPLPRSVVESSKEHFMARHCESTNFRGFSFIHDDFLLPERRHSEVEHFWNNVDEDGESLSEAASSKMGGDDDDETRPLQPPMTTVDEEAPKKKKRPPRKRKKKGAATNTASSMASSMVSSVVSNENVETKNNEESTQQLETKNATKEALPETKEEQSSAPKATSNNDSNPKTLPAQTKTTTPPPKPKKETWQPAGSAAKKQSTPVTTTTRTPQQQDHHYPPYQQKQLHYPHSKPQRPYQQQVQQHQLPQHSTWGQKRASPAATTPGRGGLSSSATPWVPKIVAAQQQSISASSPAPTRNKNSPWGGTSAARQDMPKTPAAAPTPNKAQVPVPIRAATPAPGSWAAKIQTTNKSPHPINTVATRTPQKPTTKPSAQWSNAATTDSPAQVPPSPSTDWRSHKFLSPEKSPRKIISVSNDFPSLGNFPAPPTLHFSSTNQPQVKSKPVALKGAWASKAKS